MVPRPLEDLPSDILSQILDNLLPPIFSNQAYPSQSLIALSRTPDPLDLFQVTCTCKTLHNIALPWIYRRLHYGTENTTVGRWNYLRDHPEAGVHVRLFLVDYMDTYNDEGRNRLASLLPAMQFMENLQVLILRPHGLNSLIMSQTAKELVSKPRLEALFTSSPFPMPDMPCSRSLRHLSSAENYEKCDGILETIPQLESLSIVNWLSNSVHLQTLPISWDRLRSIEIQRFSHWRSLLDSFVDWKRASNRSSPLVEVVIHETIESHDFSAIIDAFEGQNLQILALSYVSLSDERIIRRLAQAFPQLRLLRLFTCSWCSSWDVEFSVIAEALESLKVLTELQWNYVDNLPRQPSPSEYSVLLHLLPKVAAHSQSLKCVKFHEFPYVYPFTRSGDGSFGAEEDMPFRYSLLSLRGSSWSCDMYDHL